MAKYKGYDFCGWATRNDLRCSDGRTIRDGAFAHQDGQKVPLVWGHNHDSPEAVLGHGYLENRPGEGVFFYGYFNDSDLAQAAKRDVIHGDIDSLSIWANQLKQKAGDVLHGSIKEVSLVLSGANIGAQITYPVVVHGDDYETHMDEAYIYLGEDYKIQIAHSDMDEDEGDAKNMDEKTIDEVLETLDEDQLKAVSYIVAKVADEAANGNTDDNEDDEDNDEVEHADLDEDRTVKDVLKTFNDEQMKVLKYLVGMAASQGDDDNEDEEDTEENTEDDDEEDIEHSDFGGEIMNFNAFDTVQPSGAYLSHEDQENILDVAKKYGSLQEAMHAFAETNNLQHDDLAPVSGFGSYPVGGQPAVVDTLFPEFHDVRPGAPELVTNDQAWVKAVLSKVHRSPFSRIRTTQTDIRGIETLRAKGYQKGKEKALIGNYTVAKRETTPQTVYVKSALNRDDIVDITDFDYVAYQYKIDRMQLEKELAQAMLVGDGRDVSDADRIDPEHIRPIWTDNDIFTIKKQLVIGNSNGTNTAANFGDGYRYAMAAEEALLDAKIDYRGSGAMDMFTTQAFYNKMVLAKDLNGRRIYANKNELMSALEVNNVYNVPEMENLTRTVTVNGTEKTYKLLAIVGNLADYALGSTKGGEITQFQQFDIDFNQEKSLIETRASGATTRLYSFIVLEEEVNP